MQVLCFPAVVRLDLRRGGSASSAISGSAGLSLPASGSSRTSVGASGTGTGSVLILSLLGTAMIISSVSDSPSLWNSSVSLLFCVVLLLDAGLTAS